MRNEMVNWRIGTGYTPGYILDDEDGLQIPESVVYMELGIKELELWRVHRLTSQIDLSLHIARTPITESLDAQDRFISKLSEILSRDQKKEAANIKSIGVHLMGRRDSGIGRYGFSSHQVPPKLMQYDSFRN
jgi:hypothetical protein